MCTSSEFNGSKVDESKLVRMCKERKELIRAAGDCRYALASAHILYLQSLLDVGDALAQFVEQGMVIGIDSPCISASNHQSSEQDSHSVCSSSEFESEVGSLTDEVHGSDEVPQVTLDVNHMRRTPMEIPNVVYERPPLPTTGQRQESSKLLVRPPYEDGLHFRPHGSPMELPRNDVRSIEYGHGISSKVPMDSQPNDVRFRRYENGARFCFRTDSPHSNAMFHNYENGASFHVPKDLPPYGLSYGQYGSKVSSGATRDFTHNDPYYDLTQRSPPSPPLPKVSSWDDYFDPFGSINDIYSNFYSQANNETVFSSKSPDLLEVREREGIPNLEDETLHDSKKETSKEVEVDGDMVGDLDGSTSEATSVENDEVTKFVHENEIKSSYNDFLPQENEMSNGPEDNIESSTDSLQLDGSENEDAKEEGVSSEVGEAFTQEGEAFSHAGETTFTTHCTRNLQEVVKDINDAFKTAFDSAKEVLVMLEAHKLPYLAISTRLKVIYYRILGSLAPSLATSLLSPYPLWKQSASRTMKMVKSYNGNPENDVFMKSSGLLLIMEKLYVWEKRLYKEVKNEEKLRAIYGKECKRLKILDDKGAESSKIDATQSSIKSLLPKINVGVTAVDAISGRIHKLRDEELLPQVIEFIHGLMKMWKFMSECHKKQFQAIMEVKTPIHVAIAGTPRDLSLKAIMELEMKILTWGARFSDWINVQKVFVKLLNGWLFNCLIHEPEETSDGSAPFSPGKIGAPPMFIICNDWYHALERILDTRVLKTIHEFASTLQLLLEKQNEGHHQRTQADYSSEVTKRRLKSLCKMSQINLDQDASPGITSALEAPTSTKFPQTVLIEDFNAMKKDDEASEQFNDAASSSSLKEGLASIFEALELFSLESLKAYEQIRVLNGGATTQ